MQGKLNNRNLSVKPSALSFQRKNIITGMQPINGILLLIQGRDPRFHFIDLNKKTFAFAL